MAKSTAHEPTMEEILASIRRIISEDDAPAAAAEPEVVAAAPAPEPEPVPEPEPDIMDIDDIMVDEPEPFMAVEEEMSMDADEDVLELTDVKTATSLGDLDIYDAREEPAFTPTPTPAPIPAPLPMPSFTAPTTGGFEKAAMAFGALSSAMAMPKDSRSLEDFMADIMRPMIKEWLDQNLARVVEDQVKIEIERVSRISRYKD